jgi:hypothetical protein
MRDGLKANIAVSSARPKRIRPIVFVMGLPRLGLLRGGMHVAKAALEWAVVEDRRRTGAVIEAVDNLASLVDGPGRGEADLRVLLQD